jgi:ABC-type phosphate/phosphonate transport system substrate-binding protein
MAASAAAQTTGGEEAAMQAVAAAMRDAAATASDHAAKVKESASEVGTTALESISRMVYTGSYVLAYGLVYATVFVARSLPQDNPIMRGFRDGGRAAMGELEAG